MRVLQLTPAAQNLHVSVPKASSVVHSAPVRGCSPVSVGSAAALSSSRLRWSASFQTGSIAAASTSAGVPVQNSHRFAKRRTNQLVCMASTAPVEVLVKAATGQPDKLGDCPFSQRVLLTLEEKKVPYDAKFIDTSHKPAWFLEANPEGKVPVIKDDGKWVADSDVITEILEKKYPDPPLAAPASPVGSKVFPAFVQFLTSKDPSDGKEEALLQELRALDTHLKTNGPYLNGEKVSGLDLALAPKLYHLKVALGHYKKWSIPSDLTSLVSYTESIHSRQSFEKTKAPEAVVVKGWEAKVTGA